MPTNTTPFIWQEIVLQSSKSVSINISEVTTTVEIYESLEKPYLTGLIEFIDADNIYSDYNFEGSESVTITFKDFDDQATPFTKNFYISKVLNVGRANNNSQNITLHLIEDIAYIANLQNINKVYVGNSSQIISKISNNFLLKEVLVSNTDTSTIKTIIPNLDPLEAIQWIRNDATTTDGYPFYLFSTLIGDELKYVDLGTMITAEPFNKEDPYVYDPSILSHPLESTRAKKILSYDLRDVEDLYSIIKRGFIGSNLEIIDVLSGSKQNIKFDIVKDGLTKLSEQLVSDQRQVNYYPENKISYDTKSAIDGKYFHQLNTKNISQIGATRVFDNGSNFIPGYGERQNSFEYRRHIISRALQKFLKKSSMKFSIEGYEFLDGNRSHTLGNTIKLIFNTSSADDPRPHDDKMSGNYLVYEAHHVFKKERYDIKFTGVKIANYES